MFGSVPAMQSALGLYYLFSLMSFIDSYTCSLLDECVDSSLYSFTDHVLAHLTTIPRTALC